MGNNSSISDDTLMKLHVRNHTMAIYIHNKFHKIPYIGYLVIAEDVKMTEQTETPEWDTPNKWG